MNSLAHVAGRALCLLFFLSRCTSSVNVPVEVVPEFMPVSQLHFVTDSATVAGDDTAPYEGKAALRLPIGHRAYLPHTKLENSVLDFNTSSMLAPGVGLRAVDELNYKYIYLRMSLSRSGDAIPYMPVCRGNRPWQLYNYPKYDNGVTYPYERIGYLPKALSDRMRAETTSQQLPEYLSSLDYCFSPKSCIYAMNSVPRMTIIPSPV